MKTILLTLSILLFPALAQAQVSIRFGWTAPPPMVVVSPGVQVVENSGDEVFFADGHYWVERRGRWYWANDHHERWMAAPVQRVPVFIRDHHRGEYRNWRRDQHVRVGDQRVERREEHRAERREVRREERRPERRVEVRPGERGRGEQGKHEQKREEKREERRDEHEHRN